MRFPRENQSQFYKQGFAQHIVFAIYIIMQKHNPQLEFSFNENDQPQKNLQKLPSLNSCNSLRIRHSFEEDEEQEGVSQVDFLKNLFYNDDGIDEKFPEQLQFKPIQPKISNQQPVLQPARRKSVEKVLEQEPQHIQCPICGKNILIEEIATHCDQCSDQMNEVQCQYCKETIIFQYMEEHLEECIGKIEHQFKQIEQKNVQLTLECAICTLEINLKEERSILPCFHQFHVNCIQQWFGKSKTCPICLTNVE